MKNRLKLLIALALTVAVPSIVSAQGYTPISIPMKWNRGISSYGLGATDSLVISLPGPAAAVDFTDTTAWLDLAQFQLKTQTYTAEPLVTFMIYGQANTASDSIGYYIQYSDQKDIPSGNFASVTNTFTQSSVAYLSLSASTTVGSNVWGYVVALAPTSSVYTHRWYRLVVLNAEVGGTIGRRYCGVTAIVNGKRL